ncbi:MAG: GSCFA domain-containing protein [Clostridium sp.]|nr:GSCFA domain-containing protein [Bacteroides sp.]MCM1198178.1 GSCFA domain-containing protein [Clostridium sp.]
MLKLQTPVIDQKCKAGISYGDKILLLGSCFTDNIGKALKDYGFNVCVNPFGTLYNPASIALSLERLISMEPFSIDECVQMGSGSELFCSFSHHTSFARSTKEEFLENANSALAEAGLFFRECNKVIITLGTAWYFRHNGFLPDNASSASLPCHTPSTAGRIVSNCLKRNAKEFSRELMDATMAEKYLGIMASLCGLQPGPEIQEHTGMSPKHMIFTVSPIRHMADGAHGNQISKSTLLVAVNSIIQSINASSGKKPAADYFPAYEIMMDELRDYRFYAEDMVHPSQQAVGYILERFLDWALPSSERPLLEENMRRFRRSQHRQQSR